MGFLYWRLQKKMTLSLYKQFLKFGVIGGAATGIHVAVFLGLSEWFKLNYVQSNFVAYVVATLWSFVGNSYWSFGCKPSGSGFARYMCVALFGLVLSMGVSWVCEVMLVNAFVTIFWIVVLVTPSTFLLHRYWSFAGAVQ